MSYSLAAMKPRVTIQSVPNLPIFYYVIEIGDREFPLVIMPEGMSQWDDHTGRRRIRHPDHQHLELRAFAGDHHAFCQLENELLEFTVSAAVSQEILLKAVEMAQEEKMEETRTGKFQEPVGKTARNIAEMDRLLEDFFWKEVNPHLSQPI